MAHECPECGQLCYCNGDIDDCCFNTPYAVDHCQHFRECEDHEDDEYYDEEA